jgi:hypothetical protein
VANKYRLTFWDQCMWLHAKATPVLNRSGFPRGSTMWNWAGPPNRLRRDARRSTQGDAMDAGTRPTPLQVGPFRRAIRHGSLWARGSDGEMALDQPGAGRSDAGCTREQGEGRAGGTRKVEDLSKHSVVLKGILRGTELNPFEMKAGHA